MDWINKTYENGITGDAELGYFREVLTYYREGTIFESLFARPATLAVVALRDFNSALSAEERNWCFDSITNVLQHLILERESWDHQWDLRKYSLQDIGPVLYFTPSLVVLALGVPEKETRLKALFCQFILAPLHPHEFNKLFYAVRKDLWLGAPDFAYQCFVLLLAYGNLIEERSGWRKGYNDTDSETKAKETDDLIKQVLLDVHSINITIKLSHYASGFYSKAIAFVPANQDLEVFRKFTQGLLELHLESFDSGDRYDSASEYYEDREAVSHFVPRILLGQPMEFGQPIIDDLYKQYEEYESPHGRWSNKSNKEKFIESIVQNFIHAANLSEAASHEGIAIPSLSGVRLPIAVAHIMLIFDRNFVKE